MLSFIAIVSLCLITLFLAFEIVAQAKKISLDIEEAKTLVGGYVSCEDCKYLIRKEDAQVVKESYSLSTVGWTGDRYYCPNHKKSYNEKDIILDNISNILHTRYFKSNVEVDKNGKVIK